MLEYSGATEETSGLMGSGWGRRLGDAQGLLSKAHGSKNMLLKISHLEMGKSKAFCHRKNINFCDAAQVPSHLTGWGAPRPAAGGGETALGSEPAQRAPSAVPPFCTYTAPRSLTVRVSVSLEILFSICRHGRSVLHLLLSHKGEASSTWVCR